jgi:hypothetical protein
MDRGVDSAEESQPALIPGMQGIAELTEEIDFEAYERAFFAFVACAEESGWELVEPPQLTSRQLYEYQFRGTSASASAEVSLAGCAAESDFERMQFAWSSKNAPTEGELQAARDTMGECLRERGYDVPAHPSKEDWHYFRRLPPEGRGDETAVRNDFSACVRAMREVHTLRPSEVP